MSNTFRAVVERLRRDALAIPQHVFDAGRARQPGLAPYADIASVLDALKDDREDRYPAREALMQALVREHRAGNAALWASVLVVGFYPMLVRLRSCLRSDVVPRDELDQLVVTSFLVELSRLPAHRNVGRIAIRLRQRTRRHVFRFLNKERKEQHPSLDMDELAEVDADALASPPSADEKVCDVALVLERAAEEGTPQIALDVVAATMLRCELLRSYVDRVGPDDDLGRERMYQRLKRQRTRLLRRLRTVLTEVSPQPLASGL